MFRQDKDYVSISLTEGIIKVVHLKGLEVLHAVKRDVKSSSPEEIKDIIKTILSGLGLCKPNAVCMVPSSVATTKNIEIPSRDPNEIKSIIHLQAGRHTPYSREEILIGYITIGVYLINYTKVLLVIVNIHVIKDQLQIFESAGLNVEKVYFAPEGKASYYSKFLNLQDQDVPVGIIDIGSQSTDFTIEFHGLVITCRNIPLGLSQIIPDTDSAREKFIAELKKSIESYQSEDIDKVPETFIVTGDHPQIKEMEPILKENLKSDVKIMPYLQYARLSARARQQIDEIGDDSLLDVISVIASTGDYKVDLMPEEMNFQKTIQEQGREVLKMGVYAVLFLVLICVLFYSKIYFKSVFLNKLTSSYGQQRKEVEKLEAIAAKTRIVKDYLNSRMTALDITNELYSIIPNEIYLENLLIDEDGAISIKGTSESMSRVFSLVTALEDSTMFKSVKTQSTTAKKERGKDVAAFEIIFKLESVSDEEPGGEKKDGKESAAAGKKERKI